jgi:diguanylate cyclase (GGDEF)-like protein
VDPASGPHGTNWFGRVRHPGVAGRVIGTILLPLVLLSALSISVAVDRHRDVAEARAVVDAVDDLDHLLRLRAALFAERLAEEISRPDRRPPDELLDETSFGLSVVLDPDAFPAETDAALAALDDDPISLDQLRAVRNGADAPDQATTSIATRWRPLQEELDRHIEDSVDAIRRAAVLLADPELSRAAAALELAIAAPPIVGNLLGSLSDLWLAPASARPALQSGVAVLSTRFTSVSDRLGASSNPTVASIWGDDRGMPEEVRAWIDAALAGVLSTPERGIGEPAAVGIALLDGIDWVVHVDQVPAVATGAVRDLAADLAAGVAHVERLTVGLTLLAVVASIGAAVLFGRSIVSPVRRLVDQANRVGGGELDLAPLELRGPPEVVRASAAFNDVVDNLVMLERKTHALADCDFEDPVLEQPLPGLLGASLQRSVRVLSGSIVEREQLQGRLVHQANHDALTGLANRAALVAELGEVHRQDRADGAQTAVVFIDLDDFKRANDRYGHAVGDEVLRVVGRRLQAEVAGSGVVARLGGDEFVVLVRPVTDWHVPVGLARRLVRAVSEPMSIDDHWIRVGASAGVALSGSARARDGAPLDLLRCADLAVYSAKRRAGDAVSVYDEEMDRLVEDQEDLEDALADALRDDAAGLGLAFQPILDADDGHPIRVEALVRWNRPDRGEVSPAEFVPVAERSGLVVELDLWVLEAALAQLRTWSEVPSVRDLGVAVNVSGRSLVEPSFVDQCRDLLDTAGVSPGLLTVEVTETAIVTDLELAAAQLSQLRSMGIRVAIDDFGTGYTSVAHLRALPVDEIKIDSSFVQGLPDRESRVLVQMINELAHRLDVPTVAEGVETEVQVEAVREIGCDAVQGYLFARPMGADELPSWIAARSRATSSTSALPPVSTPTPTVRGWRAP